MNIILFLLIGLAAGWLASKIMKNKKYGVLGHMVIGCVGALIGGFVFDILGIVAYGLLGSMITAVVGALILLWIIGKLS